MKLIPPNITPGPWGLDAPGFIRLDEQLDFCSENIGTEREWEPICIFDEEGVSGVIALTHPTNTQAMAALPKCLKALAAIYEMSQCGPHDALTNCPAIIEIREALLAAGYTIED